MVVHPAPVQIYSNDRNSLQMRFWRAFAAEHRVGFVDLFPVFLERGGAQPADVLREILHPERYALERGRARAGGEGRPRRARDADVDARHGGALERDADRTTELCVPSTLTTQKKQKAKTQTR